MKNILRIIKKEFSRFFGDKRLVFTSLIMPGLMIYVLYTFMGSGFGSMIESGTNGGDQTKQIYTVNLPQSISQIMNDNGLVPIEISHSEIEDTKTSIMNSDTALCVVFPNEFEKNIMAYDPQKTSDAAPNIEIYYNTGNESSVNAHEEMLNILTDYEEKLSNRFDINKTEKEYNLYNSDDLMSSLMSSVFPLLLLIFMFSGCLAIAPESIAGEKERGTIATILITPIKRSELAMGKIISLAVIAFLCGVSSFLGTILSFPSLMGDMSVNIYGVSEYLNIALIIMSTILFMIAILSILSAFAKTVKEATTIISPLMIVIGLIGVSGMITGGVIENKMMFLIPLYNSVQCLSAVFSLSIDNIGLIITVISNFCYTLILVFTLTKMFNSEKIIFSK